MRLNPILLRQESATEAYRLIDKYLRELPRSRDGTFNVNAPGFQENDVDALRHAYVSAVFTQEYGEIAADMFGRLNEHFPGFGTSSSNSERSMNMDLWNNAVGRNYGKKIKDRQRLFEELLKALEKGELITNPNDKREYTGLPYLESVPIGTVVVIGKDKKGRNILFYDVQAGVVLSRADFVDRIRAGKYPRYSLRVVKGVPIPVAKRDTIILNNLG